jgi:hypothetical protein
MKLETMSEDDLKRLRISLSQRGSVHDFLRQLAVKGALLQSEVHSRDDGKVKDIHIEVSW